LFGAYFNAGECCNAGSRCCCTRDRQGFVAALAERAREVPIGDPLDPQHQGRRDRSAPSISAKIEGHVAAAKRLAPMAHRRRTARFERAVLAATIRARRPGNGDASEVSVSATGGGRSLRYARRSVALANGAAYGLSPAYGAAMSTR